MYATNAQGNYNAGRGPDGLGTWLNPSRFGTGVRIAARPTNVGGRSHFAAPKLLEDGPLTYTRNGKVRHRTAFASSGMTKRRRRRPSRAKKIRDRRQFINWIKRWAPGLYSDAKAKADLVARNEGTLDGLGSWWDTFTESISDLGGKYVQFKTQKEILDAQMERMRQGLPPLQTSEYAPTVAIKPDPGTTREITGAIGAGIGSLLPWLAVGGVGLFLLTRRGSR